MKVKSLLTAGMLIAALHLQSIPSTSATAVVHLTATVSTPATSLIR